ncbi:hypothetical protein AFERRI_580001 [Acidithiobacillus ferrivorans]|uniref:Uncharacterized protein n=2 Tax=Acidithiobacillus ferrivorans TaxID=160808 RepID=A0A060UY82_9PROT|nr:hypothetical protein AFERRI_580001 [Acidithiobacillus ferrivorans]
MGMDYVYIELWSTNFPYFDRFTESFPHDVEQLLERKTHKSGHTKHRKPESPNFPCNLTTHSLQFHWMSTVVAARHQL